MFEQVLKSALRRLTSAKKQGLLDDFGLIGGLAVSRWSVPRATLDIDFIVRLEADNRDAVAKLLSGKLRRGDINDPLVCSILYEERARGGSVPVQLLQLPPSWETLAFEDMAQEKMGKVSIPIVGWRALLLLKLYAGGPLDLQDAKNILLACEPSERDLTYLKGKAAALRVSRRLVRVLGG